MKHSSVRQQLFSLFSAAFRGRRRKKRTGLALLPAASRLGLYGPEDPFRKALNSEFFKELQQLIDLRTALRRARGNLFPEPRHLLADCQLLP